MPKRSANGAPGRELLIIGWRERVDLPEWGIAEIKTKVDTGARTSAIHVDKIEPLPEGRVRFEVVLSTGGRGRTHHSVLVEAEIVRISRVRPSTGKRQRRMVVSTLMRLGPVERRIELSLVSRHGMLCRMLLGRTALQGQFLVDSSRPTLLARGHDEAPSPSALPCPETPTHECRRPKA